jgi:hypothetical protein
LEKYSYNVGYAYQTSLAALEIQASHIRPSIQSVSMSLASKRAAIWRGSADFIGLLENNIICIHKNSQVVYCFNIVDMRQQRAKTFDSKSVRRSRAEILL